MGGVFNPDQGCQESGLETTPTILGQSAQF